MSSEDPDMTDEAPPAFEAFAGLIRSAGRRIEPPEAARARVLAAASEAWQRKTAAARRRRYATGLAAGSAAAAVIAGLLLYGSWRTPAGPVPAIAVATLERGIGSLEGRLPGERAWQPLADQATLPVGARVRTAPGARASMRLANGVSLRLAESTEVVFASPPLLELASGRAYVDNDGRRGAARVEIVTAIATVTDVGTQFEVNLAGDRYRLRVREGRVRLRLGAERIDGIAGDELTVGSDGAVARRSIAPTDDEWRWVESVATAPDVNDQPVTALLTWVARETGRVIRFKDAEVKRRAAATILHGSIRHLAPLDALSVMLATTDLDYVELSDGTLLIHARSAR
jgi:ferric-dicitrate binding protein FerR (iron transport regulator)